MFTGKEKNCLAIIYFIPILKATCLGMNKFDNIPKIVIISDVIEDLSGNRSYCESNVIILVRVAGQARFSSLVAGTNRKNEKS